jgi:NTP pyrophosphatase (non-canonical NTP hydrolase)
MEMKPMNHNRITKEEWTDWVANRWASQNDRPHDELVAIMGLGIGGEAGEVQEHIKKYLRDDKMLPNQDFIMELGDCLHYLTRIAYEFNVSLDEIMRTNIDKLERRDRGERVG